MKTTHKAIIVCALGYFIDIFDIQLFAVLRVPSLTEMGVPPEKLAAVGGYILNSQMLGMLIGAFLWGWLGDRYGRLKALYGSILIYSVGTLLCGLADNPLTYGILRFITGFGLAGETGVALTLVLELMSREKRSLGITIVAGFGTFGPAFAVILSWFLPWRTTYLVAGIMGLMLLVLRMKLVEPAFFKQINKIENNCGSLKLLMQPYQARSFLFCLMIGLPLIYAFSLLNFFSLEIGKTVLMPGEVFDQKTCLLLFYIGFGFGDIASGLLSHALRSRLKGMAYFLMFGIVISGIYLIAGPQIKFSAKILYSIYFFIGAAAGCWVLFTAIAAEHFGSNIRATTSILAGNLIRAFTIPMIFAFQALKESLGIATAAAVIGLILYGLAFFALSRLRETHGTDLDYLEKLP